MPFSLKKPPMEWGLFQWKMAAGVILWHSSIITPFSRKTCHYKPRIFTSLFQYVTNLFNVLHACSERRWEQKQEQDEEQMKSQVYHSYRTQNCSKFHKSPPIFNLLGKIDCTKSTHCRNSSSVSFNELGVRHWAIPICWIIVFKRCPACRIRRADPRPNFLLMVPRVFHTEAWWIFTAASTSALASSLLIFTSNCGRDTASFVATILNSLPTITTSRLWLVRKKNGG